ncbi:DNA primase [Nocardioides sambongensis]|uniref:DNA primase n=1 Tax=Nocardioides sambongensis TaxID=2589074 RepID=UPI001126EE48|nr:DNA primase [Nocardioides sambongensis]
MAGRIREEDIATVREKARIDEVVSAYVTLRNAGGGSQKGLCPFHDEKTPSFNVNPSRGFFHCFGCGEGGDAIGFLMKIDGLGFSDAVERLADQYGVMLRREEGGPDDRPKGPQRRRLIEAHAVAQEFYAEQLGSPEALEARRFLDERGFDRSAATTFGIGYAPRDGEALWRRLREARFSSEEVIAAGLVAMGRSHYDRFRGRLLWPIREVSGDTIGFGARRLYDDDKISAKYLNTPETPIYKKSQVLYGIDLARREMARSAQAVVVEGYTDVMACHLSGVGTAVATCGTAFGDDHARILRRFIDDRRAFGGEVIFTFDGDSAGQQAALKAFEGDQRFVAQTYIAVAPAGQDPCDLRMSAGEEAVRDLITGRRPLYRFALESVINRFDLDRADGRVDAVREAARLVASVRDQSKVTAFAQEVSKMVGADIDTNAVLAEVRRAASRGSQQRGQSRGQQGGAPQPGGGQPGGHVGGQQRGDAPDGSPAGAVAAPERPAFVVPEPSDPRFAIERETLKLVLQHPMAIGRTTAEISVDDFTHPTYAAVWQVVAAAGGPAAGSGDDGWAATVRAGAEDPTIASTITALAVEPIRTAREPDATYVAGHVFRLLELTVQRRIADLKSKLQRTDPLAQAEDYRTLFGQLAALEQHRRTLRNRIVGTP